jgi:SWI/SNF-related matrix-associated actin-dependent regulator of chromatin subfamily A-like protein 1
LTQLDLKVSIPMDDMVLEAEPLKPYPFQEEGRDFLHRNDNAILADDMGVGKTVQVAIALRGEPVLIVCPPSAVGVWKSHLRDWTDYAYETCHKLTRFPKVREALILPRSRLPTHPDILKAREKAAQETPHFDEDAWTPYNKQSQPKAPTKPPHWQGMDPQTTVVVDEVHDFKNPKSERTINLQTIMNSQPKRRWGLTGTPILSYAQDLWTIARLLGVDRKGYPKGIGQFRRLYGAYLEQVSRKMKVWKWGEPPPELQSEREAAFARFALRRMKKEVLPWLPEKRREFVTVDLESDDGEIDAMLGLNYDTQWGEERLIRAMNNPSSVDFSTLSTVRALLAEEKLAAAMEIVEQFEEAGEPLVVFSVHREVINRIGRRKRWGRILGGTPIDQRSNLCDAFQNGKLKGLACTIAAAGIGITLTAGANVLFIDRDFTPALNRQAEDRCYRNGQRRKVRVMILVTSHPVDLRVEEILTRKEALEQSTFNL